MLNATDRQMIDQGYTIKVCWKAVNSGTLVEEYYCDAIMANQWAKTLSDHGRDVYILQFNGSMWNQVDIVW